MAGAAFGAAVTGLRPVLEIMFGDFLALAMDSLVNQSAKYWYLSNEQASVPITVRSAIGAGGRFGAVPSPTPTARFHRVPGLKIGAPSTPGDAKALLKSAIRDDNPVLFFEHKRLYSMKGESGPETLPLGRANIVREGKDLTLVTAMRGVHDALEAVEKLDVDVEIIDLRTIRPLDLETITASVAKTNRLMVVEEGPSTGGWSNGVLAQVSERAIEDLDDAWRLTTDDAPIPYSPSLEDAFLPGAGAIAASITERIR